MAPTVTTVRILWPQHWHPNVCIARVLAPPGKEPVSLAFRLDKHSDPTVLRPNTRGEVVADARFVRDFGPTLFDCIFDPTVDADSDAAYVRSLGKALRKADRLYDSGLAKHDSRYELTTE